MCIEIAPLVFPSSTSIDNADTPFLCTSTRYQLKHLETQQILKCQVRTSEEALKVISTLSSERNVEEINFSISLRQSSN